MDSVFFNSVVFLVSLGLVCLSVRVLQVHPSDVRQYRPSFMGGMPNLPLKREISVVELEKEDDT